MVDGINNTPAPIMLIPPEMTAEVTKTIVDRMIETDPSLEIHRDVLMSATTAALKGAVSYPEGFLNKVNSDNPGLPPPTSVDLAPAEMQSVVSGNKWFTGNAMAMLFLLMLDLAALMSQSKLSEADVIATMVNLSMEMAGDISDLIIEISKNEAQQQRNTAIADIVGGVLNAVGSLASIGMQLKGMSISNKALAPGTTKIEANTLNQRAAGYSQTGGAIAGVTGGAGGIAKGVVGFINAELTLDRGKMEGQKAIMEAAQRIIQDRGVNAAVDAYKGFDDTIGQILQLLNKIVDENLKSHGFSSR